jgi:hypothetical protein
MVRKTLELTKNMESKSISKEDAELTSFFESEILPYLSEEDKVVLLKALETDNHEAYFSITNPILIRNSISSINKQEL